MCIDPYHRLQTNNRIDNPFIRFNKVKKYSPYCKRKILPPSLPKHYYHIRPHNTRMPLRY